MYWATKRFGALLHCTVISAKARANVKYFWALNTLYAWAYRGRVTAQNEIKFHLFLNIL